MKTKALKRLLVFVLSVMMILPIIPFAPMPVSAALSVTTTGTHYPGKTIDLTWTAVTGANQTNTVCHILVKTANNTATSGATVIFDEELYTAAGAKTTGASTAARWMIPATLKPGTYWIEIRPMRNNNGTITWYPTTTSQIQRLQIVVGEVLPAPQSCICGCAAACSECDAEWPSTTSYSRGDGGGPTTRVSGSSWEDWGCLAIGNGAGVFDLTFTGTVSTSFFRVRLITLTR